MGSILFKLVEIFELCLSQFKHGVIFPYLWHVFALNKKHQTKNAVISWKMNICYITLKNKYNIMCTARVQINFLLDALQKEKTDSNSHL